MPSSLSVKAQNFLAESLGKLLLAQFCITPCAHAHCSRPYPAPTAAPFRLTMTTACIGDAIEVYWPEDDEYYAGKVAARNIASGMHCIHYDDGEVEDIDLAREQWRFVVRPERSGSRCLQKLGRATLKPIVLAQHSYMPPHKSTSSASRHDVLHKVGHTTYKPVDKLVAQDRKQSASEKLGATVAPASTAVVTQPLATRRSTRVRNVPKHRTDSSPKRVPNKRRKLCKKDLPPLQGSIPSPNSTTGSSQPDPQSVFSTQALKLIEVGVELWAGNEIRRKCDMFSIYQCLTFTLGMLTSFALDRKYQTKLMARKGEKAEWIVFRTVDECRRRPYYKWRKPLTDSEWEREKQMLRRISTLIRECASLMGELTLKAYKNPALEAMSMILHARELNSPAR